MTKLSRILFLLFLALVIGVDSQAESDQELGPLLVQNETSFNTKYSQFLSEFKKIVDVDLPKSRLEAHGLLRRFDLQRLRLAYQVFESYLKTGRIRTMNPETLDQLTIQLDMSPELQDVFSKETDKIQGLFVSQLGQIFLKPESKTSFLDFVHECIHAYQYHVRLPLDLITLEEQGFDSESNLKFLSFAYEVEAHWLVQKIELPTEWQKAVKKFELSFGSHLFSGLFDLVTFSGSTALSNLNFNRHVTEADKHPLTARFSVRNPHTANYWFTHPVASEIHHPTTGLSGYHDWRFHRIFLGSLQKSQFYGELPYLFEESGKHRLLFNSLQNRIFENIERLTASSLIFNQLIDLLLTGQGPLDIRPENLKLLIPDKRVNQVSESVVNLKDSFIQIQRKNESKLLLRKQQNLLGPKPPIQLLTGGEGSSPVRNFHPQEDVQDKDESLVFIQLLPNFPFHPDSELIENESQALNPADNHQEAP